ncbi:MAG: tetratricopeptide repeat protein, partial [Bdellovibrionales bacterium]|nr:tetratricopeptide repeat protein [Bdellovibrionales bacterium]
VSKENFYYGLLSMLLTQAQMNDNKCSEAISLLEVVSSVPEHKHLHPESLLRMGLCYEKQNDVEKAKQYFERVTREFEESEAATQAKNFLRYLTIKGNA